MKCWLFGHRWVNGKQCAGENGCRAWHFNCARCSRTHSIAFCAVLGRMCRSDVVTDPTTPAECQEAVDAAEGALALDAARQYGLITGGPTIDVQRCISILKRGKSRGVTPHPQAIERFAASLPELV